MAHRTCGLRPQTTRRWDFPLFFCGPAFDGTTNWNTGITFPGSPGSSGAYSLMATVEHEMDEVLGLGSDLGSAIRQRNFRAYLEPALHRSHPDFGGRDSRRGEARRLLRQSRRAAGHGAQPHQRTHQPDRDGASNLFRADSVRDEQGKILHAIQPSRTASDTC